MPFYEYECANCGHQAEVMQKISDPPLRKCPACGKSALKKLISAPVFRLKGSGWYETDFKGDKDTKRNLADGPGGDSGGESKPADAAGKAADKPADKSEAKPEAKAAEKPAAKPAAEGSGKAARRKAAAPAKATRAARPAKAAKKKPSRR